MSSSVDEELTSVILATRQEGLRRLFARDVHVFARIPTEDGIELFPEEASSLSRAVEKRRREYCAGRACSRDGMRALGFEPSPLLNDDDRVPIWPDGIVGSITHTKGFCAAALASSQHYASVGIDAEPAEPVGPNLFERICSQKELDLLPDGSDAEKGQGVRTIFNVKEAFYKCIFPLTRTYLGFHDAEVEELTADSYRIRVLKNCSPAFQRGYFFYGKRTETDGMFLASLVLPVNR